MAQERKSYGQSRSLTHGEFYLAMEERPDPNGLGLHFSEWRSFFAGQERPYQQLRTALTQSPSGTVIVISAPFGAGKDTLVDVVTNDLKAEGHLRKHDVSSIHVDFDLQEGRSYEQVIWGRRSKPEEGTKPRILCINEVSYGWNDHSKESLQRQLAIAGKFLGKEVPVMVLIGDYALEDPKVVGVVGSPHEPVIIKLDPLTHDMVKQTLRQRIAYTLEREPDEIDIEAMIDPKVLAVLTPNTEYPLATMRTTLGIFGRIGKQLKPTEEPLWISPDLVRRLHIGDDLYEDFWRASEQKQQFMLWGLQHINNHDNGGTLMRAMTIEDIQQACPLDLDQEGYEHLIWELENTPDWLLQVDLYPNRYLPRQDYFLRAAFRALPLDPESEEGKAELKRMQDIIYRVAHMPRYREGIKAWEAMIQKMNSIYGWNIEYGKGLVIEGLEGYADRLRSEKEEFERRIREI